LEAWRSIDWRVRKSHPCQAKPTQLKPQERERAREREGEGETERGGGEERASESEREREREIGRGGMDRSGVVSDCAVRAVLPRIPDVEDIVVAPRRELVARGRPFEPAHLRFRVAGSGLRVAGCGLRVKGCGSRGEG